MVYPLDPNQPQPQCRGSANFFRIITQRNFIDSFLRLCSHQYFHLMEHNTTFSEKRPQNSVHLQRSPGNKIAFCDSLKYFRHGSSNITYCTIIKRIVAPTLVTSAMCLDHLHRSIEHQVKSFIVKPGTFNDMVDT